MIRRNTRAVSGATAWFAPSPIAVMIALAIGLTLPLAPARADEVKMFDRVPTVEELNAVLGTGAPGPEDGAGQPKTRSLKTRKIEMYGDSAPAAGTARHDEPERTRPSSTSSTSSSSSSSGSRPKPSASHQASARPAVDAVGFPVNFAYNSADILPESRPYIDVMADLMRQQPAAVFVVEGHTDAAGATAYNVELSARRAEAVKQYMTATHGIEPHRLATIGLGKSAPLLPAAPLDARNRRVQFRPGS